MLETTNTTNEKGNDMTNQAIRLTCAETSKMIRKDLKQFNGVKFSVRSHTYSLGASIRIEWTHGPTRKEVGAVIEKYIGADFDGMTDSATYRGPFEVDGVKYDSGADYIFLEREYTEQRTDAAVEAVAKYYDVELAEYTQQCACELYVEKFQTFLSTKVRQMMESDEDLRIVLVVKQNERIEGKAKLLRDNETLAMAQTKARMYRDHEDTATEWRDIVAKRLVVFNGRLDEIVKNTDDKTRDEWATMLGNDMLQFMSSLADAAHFDHKWGPDAE